MTRNSLKRQFLMSFFILISFLITLPALAIGQLTSPIVIEEALRGQTFEQSLSIFNTEDISVIADLQAEGDIRDWASFYMRDDLETRIESLDLEPNKRQGVVVKFSIPEDTPNSEYKGLISVLQRPGEAATTSQVQATLQQKISRQVTIKVTDQELIDFTADVISETFSVEPGEPFRFRIAYTNLGNVAIKPQAQVKIAQADKVFYNAILPYPEDEEGVKPLQTKELPTMEALTTGAVEGKARAEFAFLHNNETIDEKSVRFGIGTAADTAPAATDAPAASGINIKSINPIMLLGIALGIIIMAIITVVIRKRPKAGKREGKDKGNGMTIKLKK